MDNDCNFQANPQNNIQKASKHYFLDRESLLNIKLETLTQISSSYVEDQNYHTLCSEIKLQEENLTLQTSKIIAKLVTTTQASYEPKNPNTILRVGFLQRKSNSFLKMWKTRFCVLTNQKLLCFQDETRTHLISCLNLQRIKCLVYRSDECCKTFSLKCEDQSEHLVFRTAVVQECQIWFKQINFIINENKQSPKIKIRQPKKDIYREQDTILESELLQMAETGDILLMKTEDSSCALQRLVTNSEYDHVSMIVKFNNKDVKIFQANADEGVQIYDWDHFHNRFNHFQKVCLRKLYHSQKKEIHPILLSFIKKMIGSKYKMNALKLINRFSDEELAQGPRHFFCSELIARAYKQVGLLHPQKASNSYWPVDFTIRGGIVLQNGSLLGPERLILLKKHIKTFQ